MKAVIQSKDDKRENIKSNEEKKKKHGDVFF